MISSQRGGSLLTPGTGLGGSVLGSFGVDSPASFVVDGSGSALVAGRGCGCSTPARGHGVKYGE
ncbi:MAG: hypothetical protein ACRCY9_15330, partial [Phycicoccus sp.]